MKGQFYVYGKGKMPADIISRIVQKMFNFFEAFLRICAPPYILQQLVDTLKELLELLRKNCVWKGFG